LLQIYFEPAAGGFSGIKKLLERYKEEKEKLP
jgi:hypothetical protein